jgi:hypothetical protein
MDDEGTMVISTGKGGYIQFLESLQRTLGSDEDKIQKLVKDLGVSIPDGCYTFSGNIGQRDLFNNVEFDLENLITQYTEYKNNKK